jgi:uncharacterized RDD family membrane protein YckC
MGNDNWFYAKAGQQLGPVSLRYLSDLARCGQIEPTDLVWSEGMSDWAPASTVSELFSGQHATATAVLEPARPVSNLGGEPRMIPGQAIGYYTPDLPQFIWAGFWLRFCAYVIDAIITGIAGAVVGFIVGFLIGATMGAGGSTQQSIEVTAGLVGRLLSIVMTWLYFAMMESSSRQATLGKMALGLVVTDMNGARISFGRATGRHFAKIISVLTIFIGYMMAGFTERRQGLHDILAGTLVIKKNG